MQSFNIRRLTWFAFVIFLVLDAAACAKRTKLQGNTAIAPPAEEEGEPVVDLEPEPPPQDPQVEDPPLPVPLSINFSGANSFAFGSVERGMVFSKSVTLVNGTPNVVILFAAPVLTQDVAGIFQVTANTCQNPQSPTGSCKITVQFSPQQARPYGGMIQMMASGSPGSNAVSQVVNIPLSGLGEPISASLSANKNQACASVDGVLKCWGRDLSGDRQKAPVAVTSLSGVRKVSVGEEHICAIAQGVVKCWGENGDGQLGDASTQDRNNPVNVIGLTGVATQISVGKSHSCAVVGGAAKCWGDNKDGQLGTGSSGGKSSTPVTPIGLTSGVTAIAAGEDHTCAVKQGVLYCFGSNDRRQLGLSGSSERTTPTEVPLSQPVTAVSASKEATCAIDGEALKCWGVNTQGRLGIGSASDAPSPTRVNEPGTATHVFIGPSHACAVIDGASYCWGGNASGQLGNNSVSPSQNPVAVAGDGEERTAVAVGAQFSCSISSEGSPMCWGANNDGQLGNNSTTNSKVPVTVSW